MYFPESLQLIADTLWRVPEEDATAVLEDLFTPSEIVELGERIAILQQLKQGKTQRDVAEDLGISVTTVSRGARVLKYGKGAIRQYIE